MTKICILRYFTSDPAAAFWYKKMKNYRSTLQIYKMVVLQNENWYFTGPPAAGNVTYFWHLNMVKLIAEGDCKFTRLM